MLHYSSPIVFIVEAERPQRSILRNCFMALGYKRIYTFDSPEECLEGDAVADVIVTEQNFRNSEITGIKLMWMYKSQHPGSNFFFYTKESSLEIAEKALQDGAVDYFRKGLSGMQSLVANVQQLVAVRREKIQSVSSQLLTV